MTRHTTKFLERCLQLALVSTMVSAEFIGNFQSVLSKNNNQYPEGRDQITNLDHAQYDSRTYMNSPEEHNVQWSKELKTQEEWDRSPNINDNWDQWDIMNQQQQNYQSVNQENSDAGTTRQWLSIPVKEQEDPEKREPISEQLVMNSNTAYQPQDDLTVMPSNTNTNLIKWNGFGGNLNLDPVEVKPWSSLTSSNGFQNQWNSPTIKPTTIGSTVNNPDWDKLINDLTKKIMAQTKLNPIDLTDTKITKTEPKLTEATNSKALDSINSYQGWNSALSQTLPSPVNWSPPKSATLDLTHLGNTGTSSKTEQSNSYQPIQAEVPKTYNYVPTQSQSYSFPAASKPVTEPHEAVQEIKVPVPQPYMVPIPVPQPFQVPIFKVVPKEVEKRIPITVEKLVPKYIEKPYKIEMEIHHPKPMIKKYPVHVTRTTYKQAPKKRLRLRKKTIRWY